MTKSSTFFEESATVLLWIWKMSLHTVLSVVTQAGYHLLYIPWGSVIHFTWLAVNYPLGGVNDNSFAWLDALLWDPWQWENETFQAGDPGLRSCARLSWLGHLWSSFFYLTVQVGTSLLVLERTPTLSPFLFRATRIFLSAPLFTVVSSFASSFSESILTQPPSISAPLGSTVKLTCSLKSGISVGSKAIYWYQQMQGSPPWFFLRYYSDSNNNLGPGVTNRVSGSKDTSKNAAELHISQLQEDDEADYYCTIWESNVSHSDTGRWGSRYKS